MKKLGLFSLFTISFLTANAQLPDDFNVGCLTASMPAGWSVYNPPSTPAAVEGAWKCTATNGKPNGSAATPGVYCTGFYLGAHHLDTSYLITPPLDLLPASFPTSHAYLHFDSKKVNNTTTGRLSMTITKNDTFFVNPLAHLIVNDSDVTPMFSAVDATQWHTYEIDLSDSIGKGPFRFAFRFTSSTSASLAWYMDNIRLSGNSLSIDAISKQKLPIGIVGNSTPSKIELSYSALAAGTYRVSLYDIMGRELYNGQVEAKSGPATYIINGLNLHSGMYCIKMGNENAYGTAKLIIE